MADKNALAVTRLTAELEQEKKRAAWEKGEQARFHLGIINKLENEVDKLEEVIIHLTHPDTGTLCRQIHALEKELEKLRPGPRPGDAADRKRVMERRHTKNIPWDIKR